MLSAKIKQLCFNRRQPQRDGNECYWNDEEKLKSFQAYEQTLTTLESPQNSFRHETYSKHGEERKFLQMIN